MDEKNPFLDEYTLNKVKVDTYTNRNHSKNSLINYTELISENYSAKNSNRHNQVTNGNPSMLY